MRRSLFIAALALLALAAGTHAGAQEVLVDQVDGLAGTDSVLADTEITFHIRVRTGDTVVYGMTNGFRFFSPDGTVTWDTLTGEWTDGINDYYYSRKFVTTYGLTGTGADTIGFAGFMWIDPHEPPPDLDTVAWTISIGPIPADHVGKQICIDSSFYQPAGKWLWSVEDGGWNNPRPDWSGQQCYTIVTAPPCCVIRGDVDDSGSGPDIADLIALIGFVNNGTPVPPCMDQADVNDDDTVNQADVDYLYAYMFSGGPVPLACD